MLYSQSSISLIPSPLTAIQGLGRIISVTQFLSAALMRPLFPDIYPPEMTLFERRKLPYPAVLVYIFTTRGSPFGLLVSSCANAGSASSVKCAAIGMQLCLPLATVAVFLGSALLVYIRARERYGTGKVQLPRAVRSPAWLLANVAELGISGSTQAEGGAPVHVMRFSPRTLYCEITHTSRRAPVANFTFPERGPPSPFWNLVSTCAAAEAGFASDAKCAGIALHLFLPYLNVISGKPPSLISTIFNSVDRVWMVGLWIGWVIYRRALAVHGSGEIKLPPMYIAAWVEGRVGELDKSVENAKMKEELSAV
ncbi:hypothetical protein B0H11DRAFT_1954715 [Mycena galericulata]|nr:hypothetical protein B0H11DRAFT_1954715 [Mycena galericulata]